PLLPTPLCRKQRLDRRRARHAPELGDRRLARRAGVPSRGPRAPRGETAGALGRRPMHGFETVVGLLLVAVALAALARRLRAPYPALLALGGAGLAFVPGAPALTIPPDLALALFVAPVLLDA